MKSRLEDWVHIIYRVSQESNRYKVGLGSSIFLTLFFAYQLSHLQFNYNIESFFSKQDEGVVLYDDFKAHFGNENNVLLVGIEAESGVFNRVFLTQVDALADTLAKLSDIDKVDTPTRFKRFVKIPIGGYMGIPVLHLEQPELLKEDSVRIYNHQDQFQSYFSTNSASLIMVLHIRQNLTNRQNETLIAAISQILEREHFQFEAYHLAGRIHTQHYYIGTMQKEMLYFSILAILLFCTSVYVIFRQWQFVMIPLVVIVISLVWVFGFVAYIGWTIDLMITIVPTLMFVLSTSVSIHLLSRFHHLYALSGDKYDAVKQAFLDTSIPNILISVTTATGLFSLCFMPVPSIQRFGVVSAVGIMISIILGLQLIPLAIKFLSINRPVIEGKTKAINKLVIYLVGTVKGSNKKWILGFFLMLIMVCSVGILRIQIGNNFLDDLNDSSPLKQDLLYFERNFSGIRPFEMVIAAKNTNQDVLDYEHILALDSLEHWVKSTYAMGMVNSPIVLMKTLNQSMNGGTLANYRLPTSPVEFKRLMKEVKKKHLFDRIGNLISDDRTLLRMSGRVGDHGNQYFQDKNDELKAKMSDHPMLKVKLTGVAYLIDKSNEKITRYLIFGLLLVVGVVVVLLYGYSQSVTLTVLALIVNLMPLIVSGAVMGAMGIPLKISTAIIFTIVLGISVDDTIHFLHYYLKMLDRYPVNTAVKLSLMQMTKPIVFTTIVLFSGFLIFSISSFESIQTLGWMTAMSLVIAMMADVILLPILIIWKHNKRCNTKHSSIIRSQLVEYGEGNHESVLRR